MLPKIRLEEVHFAKEYALKLTHQETLTANLAMKRT
jgi:hypothetical protein